MICEYFNKADGSCEKDMPLGRLYMGLICERHPEKCPLVAGVVDFKAARLN